jgi:hypothetical protein
MGRGKHRPYVRRSNPPATGAVLQSGIILCILREASWTGPLIHHLAPIPAAGFAPRKS